MTRVWGSGIFLRIVTIVVGIGVIGALFNSVPERKITLEAGTQGGLYDIMVRLLAERLDSDGIKVSVVNRPDSLRIVDDVADPQSEIDAGFISSDVPIEYHDTISQLGTVVLAPVYLLTHQESDVREITDFAGKSISLYPEGSAAWATCEYVLGSFGIDMSFDEAQYGNGPTIVKNVAQGITDVGCFLDVPPGSTVDYANEIMTQLADERLRLIDVPQAQAIQARRDYLRPLTVPAGAFQVFPPLPSTDVATMGASITFVAKNSLPRELVTVITDALSQDYRNSTVANEVGELPSLTFTNVPVSSKARDVLSRGVPWMYERFSFATAGFLDKFVNRYGIVLIVLFLFLSLISDFGLPRPYQWVIGSRPRRFRYFIESIERRTKQTGQLSRRDKRKLATIEKWIDKQSTGIDALESQLRSIRTDLDRELTD